MSPRPFCWRTILLVATMPTAGLVADRAAADGPIVLDVSRTGPTISPLLFGHNIEITRRGGWQGLAAEQVANRKFAAAADGMPRRWATHGAAARVSLDTTGGYAGRHSTRIEVPAEGGAGGISQAEPGLAVTRNRTYLVRLVVASDAARNVVLRLRDVSSGDSLFEKRWAVPAGDWQPVAADCVAAATSERCRLEIESEDPGVFRVGAVSILPGDAFHGMRRDVVDLLKRLKPGCLRFPGGCYAEFYPWQDGLLPVDRRPPIGPTGLPFLLPHSDDHDDHEIGIDEFLSLCREVGAEPAITVRLSDAAPADAAAWVEYCNGATDTRWGGRRAERGCERPHRVDWWFIGNEVYFFGRGGVNQPVAHASKSLAFAEAMHAVDPKIRLVPCTQFVNGAGSPAWNRPLLASVGHLAQAASVHQYALDQAPLATPADYGRMLRAPQTQVRPMLGTARESLDALAHLTPDRRCGLVYDEWNLKWDLRGSVPMALYGAGVLNLMCREAETFGLEMACFFMPVNEGAIAVEPQTAALDTAGHVFALFQDHQGGTLIRTPSVTADTDVDVCASMHAPSDVVVVTAVNRSLEAANTVAFEVRSRAAPQRVVVDHLVPASLAVDERKLLGSQEILTAKADGTVEVALPPAGIARLRMEWPSGGR